MATKNRTPTNRTPTHPGEILRMEFLIPMAIAQTTFAAHLGISVQRINELVNGKRGVTPATAWLLAKALRTTPEFWMNLQMQHDLAKAASFGFHAQGLQQRSADTPAHCVEKLAALDYALRRGVWIADGDNKSNVPGSGFSSISVDCSLSHLPC